MYFSCSSVIKSIYIARDSRHTAGHRRQGRSIDFNCRDATFGDLQTYAEFCERFACLQRVLEEDAVDADLVGADDVLGGVVEEHAALGREAETGQGQLVDVAFGLCIFSTPETTVPCNSCSRRGYFSKARWKVSCDQLVRPHTP